MKKMNFLHLTLVLVLILGFASIAFAESSAELAKESETAAAASATTKPTPEQIMEKVNTGCELLQTEGMTAIRKFQGTGSPFIFSGTYIWIHNMQGKMVMHPIKYKLDGKSIIGLKDASGKLFFSEMNQVAKAKGSGWVSYMWPKPGEKKPSKKVSYVKICPVEGQELVLGCGVYGISEADIKAAQ